MTDEERDCIEIIKEARRTGQTDGIVKMLRRPLTDDERRLLAEFLGYCQLISKRGAPRKMIHEHWEKFEKEEPVLKAMHKLRAKKVPVATCIEQVRKQFGRSSGAIANIWKNRHKDIPF
jgi:hypothetical protein